MRDGTRGIVALLLLFLIAACAGREVDRLEGLWAWDSAEGGHLREHVTTEFGSGLTLDLHDGSFTAKRADSEVVTGTYRVGVEGIGARLGTEGPTLIFSPTPPVLDEPEWVLRTRGDTLWLFTLTDDGFDHAFRRVR